MNIRKISVQINIRDPKKKIPRESGQAGPVLRVCLVGLGVLWFAPACTFIPSGDAQPKSRKGNEIASVDVQVAKATSSPTGAEFTGTTAPRQEVVLRSQIQGQLLKLQVEVGDPVRKGQILGRQDDGLLKAGVNEARAQRAAQTSEVASAESRVGEVKTRVAQAQLQLDQAKGNVIQLQQSLEASIEAARLEAQQTQTDAQRLTQLAKAGATTVQLAEQARTQAKQAQQSLINLQASAIQQITQAQTAVKTAEQLLRAAIAQVAIEQKGVDAAHRRVLVQQAVLTQAQEQQSYALLSSPIQGQVMARLAEAGNLLQPGNDILRLGDFSQIKVVVQVSERMLPQLQVGQLAQVRLDAYPRQVFRGQIARIPPAANPTSRLLPIEVVMANDKGNIGSGLLARVSFRQPSAQRVQIPNSALQTQTRRRGQSPSKGRSSPLARRPRSHPTTQSSQNSQSGTTATLFVVLPQQKQVKARSVTLGKQSNGQVEIINGLVPGEQFVARSSQPLKDGAKINFSAISDIVPPED